MSSRPVDFAGRGAYFDRSQPISLTRSREAQRSAQKSGYKGVAHSPRALRVAQAHQVRCGQPQANLKRHGNIRFPSRRFVPRMWSSDTKFGQSIQGSWGFAPDDVHANRLAQSPVSARSENSHSSFNPCPIRSPCPHRGYFDLRSSTCRSLNAFATAWIQASTLIDTSSRRVDVHRLFVHHSRVEL